MHTPVLLGALGVGIVLMLVVVGLFYASIIHGDDTKAPVAKRRPASIHVSDPVASPSRVMRGNHWQLVPGGFSSFGTGTAREEVY